MAIHTLDRKTICPGISNMSDNQKHCAVCNNAGKQLCKGCQNINYCSRTCQESDWPTHKDSINRSSPDSRRAILFPINEGNPKFIWLNNIARGDPDDGYYEAIDWKHLLQGDEGKPQYPPGHRFFQKRLRLASYHSLQRCVNCLTSIFKNLTHLHIESTLR